MFLQQFSDHFVLLLNFRFQGKDLPVFGIVMLDRLTRRLENHRRICGELLLSSIDLRGLEPELITEIRNRRFVDEVPQDDGGFFLGGKSSS